jgi:acetyl esterase/lipase
MNRAQAPLLAAAPDVPGVAIADHLVPGRDRDPDVRVRVYQRVDRAHRSAVMVWIHGGGMCFGSVEGDDFMWNRDANRHGWSAYLAGHAGAADVPIYAAPARATVEQLRGLPPAYIDVGELDPFRDEDIAYAARLLEAGVPCELHVTPGVFHASESRVLDVASSRRIRGYRNDVLERVLAGEQQRRGAPVGTVLA